MRKKVLILGSTGMLGHQVYYHFKKEGNFEVINVSYRNKLTPETIILDLNNKFAMEKLLKEQNPDFIVNCVGVLIKGANDNPANAIYLNAYLPHLLARICDEINAKLIHISTDCVFSGEKGSYIESDEKDGNDIYAKTKALGEVQNTDHLTLRTSIIGPELKENGEGLFHWFMKQQGETNGFTKALWSGVTTSELAKVIEQAIKQDLKGLYHVTNGQPINKYELLQLFKKATGKDIDVHSVEGKKADKSFIDTRKELQIEVSTYPVMINQMVDFMRNHKDLYKDYSIALSDENFITGGRLPAL
ncbi:MAG TPA: SDR family oxidoreductase [Gillisia sp.]|nr:SDR family oxidoreductase [Gillisia sp.]